MQGRRGSVQQRANAGSHLVPVKPVVLLFLCCCLRQEAAPCIASTAARLAGQRWPGGRQRSAAQSPQAGTAGNPRRWLAGPPYTHLTAELL